MPPSTFHQRFVATKKFITSEEVSIKEAAQHIYWWVAFEYTMRRRNRLGVRAAKYAKKLNANLDVYLLRKEMSEL